MSKPVKALVLFSGGLDSLLAIKLLEAQDIQVTALIFKSYFFNEIKAVKICRHNKINYKVANFSRKHLNIVKKPKYGYGKAINPCIDCHSLMLKEAKKIMRQEKYDFIATGEVLGQRPMSQNIKALKIVAREANLDNLLLRPLSAKKLNATQMEKDGLILRDKLLDIQGRSRKRQLALAKKYNLLSFSTPAGGCILTNQIFAQRLKKLFEYKPNCNGNDIELLKYGRHFWENKNKIIVGRNAIENKKLEKLWQNGDFLVMMLNYNGPTTLIRNYGRPKASATAIKRAKKLTQFYSTSARLKTNIEFKIKN